MNRRIMDSEDKLQVGSSRSNSHSTRGFNPQIKKRRKIGAILLPARFPVNYGTEAAQDGWVSLLARKNSPWNAPVCVCVCTVHLSSHRCVPLSNRVFSRSPLPVGKTEWMPGWFLTSSTTHQCMIMTHQSAAALDEKCIFYAAPP